MDFALRFNNIGEPDIAATNGVPAIDDGFETAIYISLFTDARASDEDVLPDNSGDKRGWWANSLFGQEDQLGSKLWLLSREKTTADVPERARTYCLEALDWLKRDGVVSAIEVDVERSQKNELLIEVRLYRGGEVAGSFSYQYNWAAQLANPVHKRGL